LRTTASGRDLSDDQVVELFVAYRERRDVDARETLIGHFRPLVESIARQYMRYGEPHEDLVQEGLIGLIKAVEMYDPRRGVKFATYGTHLVQGEIKHYLRDRTGIIREPGWLHELNQKIARATEELTQKHGRYPTVAEIAELVNVEEDAVMEVMRTRTTFRVGSLDAPEEEGDTGPRLDLSKMKAQHTLPFSLPIEDRIVLTAAMQKLKRLEREVVEYFFFRDLSQTEIARRLGISCNYVSHLIRSSLNKLRRTLVAQEHQEASLRVRAALDRRRAYLDARERLGAKDPVTGLYLTPQLEERLHEEVLRSRRYGHELGFALLEVERFATFVSEHGDIAGNQALTSVAQILVANLRRVDFVARYGQLGFGCVLPHTSDATIRVVERLVKRVAKERLGALTPRGKGLQLRAGVAVFPVDGLSADDIFEAARDALSQVKDSTRRILRAQGMRLDEGLLDSP